MKNKKAIIIGSGVAGMATAIRLAIKGFEVSVYEKNAEPGGKLTAFENNGFKFDAGPSLFTAPKFLEELFADANEPIEEYFSYKKLPIACKYFYEDATVVNAFTNNEQFAKELNTKLGENEKSVINYLNKSKRLYQNTGSFFINHSLHKLKYYFTTTFLKAFNGVRLNHVTNNLHNYNLKNFSNSKTVQLFNRFATYNGSNPYKASAMLSQISHLEHNDGTYYPNGGMISITNALYNLALKKGVQFFFNKKVDRIISFNNKVKGVVVDGKNVFADTVVSNMDVYFTFKNLLENHHIANKILKKERSSSALIFYWGINKDFEELDIHNILFSNSYDKEFQHIFKHNNFSTDPTIYINITSKAEPEIHAPKGKQNWFVMINVTSNNKINWEDKIDEYKQIVVKKINKHLKTNIEEFIETENILHPNKIETNTNAFSGSLYGTSSNSKLAAFLRPANFNKSYKGLYFVGGTVHPGGGIPLCLKSAEIVSKLVK